MIKSSTSHLKDNVQGGYMNRLRYKNKQIEIVENPIVYILIWWFTLVKFYVLGFIIILIN